MDTQSPEQAQDTQHTAGSEALKLLVLQPLTTPQDERGAGGLLARTCGDEGRWGTGQEGRKAGGGECVQKGLLEGAGSPGGMLVKYLQALCPAVAGRAWEVAGPSQLLPSRASSHWRRHWTHCRMVRHTGGALPGDLARALVALLEEPRG